MEFNKMFENTNSDSFKNATDLVTSDKFFDDAFLDANSLFKSENFKKSDMTAKKSSSNIDSKALEALLSESKNLGSTLPLNEFKYSADGKMWETEVSLGNNSKNIQ